MEKLQNYIKPELLVLIPVLYILGLMLKKTEKINDKYIPVMLGVIGIVLSALYVVAVSGICLMSVFTAVTQGILVAGATVYVDQLVKQNKE